MSQSIAGDDRGRWPRRLWRPLAGVAISTALIALLAVRTDLADVGRVLFAAAPVPLVLALGLVCVEVGVRALRWKVLLDAIRPAAYPRVLACLCIGYFANSLLPARMGDLARAQVAGTDLRIPRLATLGTILIERLADAVTIAAAVVGLGLLIPAAHAAMVTSIVPLVGLAVAAVLVGVVAIALRGRSVANRAVETVGGVIGRISQGGAALRSPRRVGAIAVLTVAGFGLAVAEYLLVAESVELRLTVIEAAVVMGALALSTSIPAAPGSLGTYEFVGVAVLTQLGAPPITAAASVILMHVVVIVPPAIAGLVAMWTMKVQVGSFRGQAVTLDPLRLG